MFKSPIEWLKEAIQELIGAFANMAFDWISIFMLKPTDFTEYDKIDILYEFVFSLSVSLSVVFIGWSLLSIIFNTVSGMEGRSISEVLTKAIGATIIATSIPWLMEWLVKLNNAIVKYFLDRGLDTEALEKYTVIGNDASLAIILMGFVIAILFVLLGMQYIQRIGEYIVLLTMSPLAAHSIITQNFDIFSMWWREVISVIFSQAFQVGMLWLVLNMLTGTQSLKDYLYAIGLMVIILKGPKFMRQFLYSSGAGRSVIGVAGGAGKMTMYKYAAAKITRR